MAPMVKPSGIAPEAKLAVIVPGPLTVAVVILELAFVKVMEPVLLDH